PRKRDVKDIPLDLHLRMDEARGVFVVELAVDSSTVEEVFSYNFANRRLSRVLEGIENNHCSLDDLKEIGVNLWAGLMAGKVGERFEAIRREIEEQTQTEADFGGARFQLRLGLPPELEGLPWEALYQERDFAFLACHPDHC